MPDSREPGLKLSDAGGVNNLQAADRALPVFACPTPSPVARQEERSRAPADRVERIQTYVDQVARNSAPWRMLHAQRTGAACWCREIEVWAQFLRADPRCVSGTTLRL
jgi:hypothetical protein